MAKSKDTTIEARERPGEIVEALRQAGVDRDLTMRVFECIETERAQAIAKAARLFCNRDEGDPITPGQFDDMLSAMRDRLWGISSAVCDGLGGRDDTTSRGVMQLLEDAAREMERIAEAFDAENWLVREREARSPT